MHAALPDRTTSPSSRDPHDLLEQLRACDADAELAELRSGAATFLGAMILAGPERLDQTLGTMLRRLRTARESLWVHGRPLPSPGSLEGRRIELITRIEQALRRLRSIPLTAWTPGDQLRARNAIYLYARLQELPLSAEIDRGALRCALAGRTVRSLFELLGERPVVCGRVRRRTVSLGYTLHGGRVLFCLVNRYRQNSAGHAEIVFSPVEGALGWSKVLD